MKHFDWMAGVGLTMGQLKEIIFYYPSQWEECFRRKKLLDQWVEDFPEEFDLTSGMRGHRSTDRGLSLLPQYALMYILLKDHGVRSITWYKIAKIKPGRVDAPKIAARWEIMRRWMGSDRFNALQSSLVAKGFRNMRGEPDLFCWYPTTGYWFFAEAKGKGDSIKPIQRKWFDICWQTLGYYVDIRIYSLLRR